MFNGVKFSDVPSVNPKACTSCGSAFYPNSGVQKYCSDSCKTYEARDPINLEKQYERINSSVALYLNRIVANTRRSKQYAGLTRDELLEIWEDQEGLCAITGVPMTHTLVKGQVFYTNASADRIEVGGPYSKDNIRLVCSIVNKMRHTLSDEELLWWTG
jgi:hypothetical protein